MFQPVHGASWEFLQEEQTSQFEAENVDGASHLSPKSKRDQLTCTTANEREGDGLSHQAYIREEKVVPVTLLLTDTRRAPLGRNWPCHWDTILTPNLDQNLRTMVRNTPLYIQDFEFWFTPLYRRKKIPSNSRTQHGTVRNRESLKSLLGCVDLLRTRLTEVIPESNSKRPRATEVHHRIWRK